MTSNQMKRIRSKLEQAARLTAEADDLATAGHAEHSLRQVTARAADDMTAAQRNLAAWDDRMRAQSAAIISEMECS